MKYGIEYEPKIEDPVVIKVFDTIQEAEAHMEMIKTLNARTAAFHRIVEVDDLKQQVQQAHWEEVSK
jgi:hypothetical protein|tara:strand:- start:5 stop:205 length:201 start_codon:yes stop_codon:yes gene_type:complete